MPPEPADVTATNRSECNCLQLKTILETANLALADLTEQAYGSDTTTSLPLEVCQTCLELLNTAGSLTVAGVSVTGRRLLQLVGSVAPTTTAGSLCPNAIPEEPFLPSVVMPPSIPPTAINDAYICPWNDLCVVPTTEGVLANDTTPNIGGVMNMTGVVTPPPSGTLVLYPNGSFTYNPVR